MFGEGLNNRWPAVATGLDGAPHHRLAPREESRGGPVSRDARAGVRSVPTICPAGIVGRRLKVPCGEQTPDEGHSTIVRLGSRCFPGMTFPNLERTNPSAAGLGSRNSSGV